MAGPRKMISLEEQREKAEKFDQMQAQLRLMCELAEGRRSGEKEGGPEVIFPVSDLARLVTGTSGPCW